MRSVEPALCDVTPYERINYLILMMVDPDVHFDVIPRYPGGPSFIGADYHVALALRACGVPD